jgi:8-oxo-dGTP pyrophosphatase MutT (NUDIX family)
MPGFWVFAGGTVRRDDLSEDALTLAPDFSPALAHAALSRPPSEPPPTPIESYALLVTAARELFEEADVLLATSNGTEERPVDPGRRALLRDALERGQPFSEVASDLGMQLDLDQLVYYAHWITPLAIPARFDTRFFLALLPENQEPSPSPVEMSEGRWVHADEALAAGRSHEMRMHFATLSHLRRLAPHERLRDLLEFARIKPILTVLPPTLDRDGSPQPFLPPEIDDVW